MVQGVAIDDNNCLINTNPATGEILSRVPCTTRDQLDKIVEVSKSSQTEWKKKSVEERIDILKAAVKQLSSVSNPMKEWIVKEMGKPLQEAEEEVDEANMSDEYFAIMLESLQPKKDGVCTVVRHPYGVVAIMSPWNFPLGEIMLLAMPSLASGNTVIVKPSEVVPETGALLVETLNKSLPPGILQIAQGEGKVGAALVNHPGVDLVAMTGSSATGKKILESAAPNLKRVILEMGGKDPFVVCDDADLELAAKDAVAYSLCNTGQVCCSVERIYVAESVYDRFQTLVSEEAKNSYRVGNGMDPTCNVGPMVSKMQADRVKDQVDDAVKKGAKLLHKSDIPVNGGSEGGSYHPVTVLADVTDEMKLFSDETFGPVVAMTKFDGSEEEAIRLSNNTEYGLGSSVYTKDSQKGSRIASSIDAGQVGINCWPLALMTTNCPWVGHKSSGFGFHSGRDGCLQFSIPKTIVSN